MRPGGDLELVLDTWMRPAPHDTFGYQAAKAMSVIGGVVISDFAGEIVTLNDVRAYFGLLPVSEGGILYLDYLQDQRRKGYAA